MKINDFEDFLDFEDFMKSPYTHLELRGDVFILENARFRGV